MEEFDNIYNGLVDWRNEDQGDKLWLSRHEVMVLLEGIYLLAERGGVHYDMRKPS